MGWTITWWTFGLSAAISLLAGLMQWRRGLGRWSLPPWDFILLAAAICLLFSGGHLLELWRDG